MNETKLLGVVDVPDAVVVAVPSGTRLHVIVAGCPFAVRGPLAVDCQVTVVVESRMNAEACEAEKTIASAVSHPAI
jgi:dissimilatory sulfite reductase (desulfoviridin) alpha/beta subunit